MAQPGRRLKLLRAGAAEAPSAAELIAALPYAVLVISPDGLIAQVNAAAEALLNTSEGHLIGLDLAKMIGLPDRPPLSSDDPFMAYDVDIRTPKGVQLRADISASPLAERPGWRLITLASGLAAPRSGYLRERAPQRVAISMAAMLAHEIKNPLSGIRGAAQLLERQSADAGAKSMTKLIRDEVDRVAGLIDQMQGFTDTRTLERTPENIYAILDHVRALAASGFAQGLAIRDSYDPSLPPVLVHRDSLIQVLVNLLKNASEAIDPKSGKITITTAYRHGVSVSVEGGARRLVLPIELCIIDNGPGPPRELVENLFEPFVSSKSSGRGLGLALADKLMRDMGGMIQFAREGDPERTVFRLLLPRAGGKK
jgi:two-component system nitrogen regulation sensor histidine kinase GlnL